MDTAGVGAGYRIFLKSLPYLFFFGGGGACLFFFSYHCLQDFVLDMPFPCTAGFFWGELSPHLRLFLMI